LHDPSREPVLTDAWTNTTLQDESNPDFVSGLIALYFEDASKKLRQLREMLRQPAVDRVALDGLVHQFKGSSASFGAAEMTRLCVSLREDGKNNDVAACMAQLERMEEAFARLQQTLWEYSRLEKH
jgi:histidine-containing phosphotransfer protein